MNLSLCRQSILLHMGKFSRNIKRERQCSFLSPLQQRYYSILFTPTHEYFRILSDTCVQMGITRFALQRLENIVYIDTGRKGDTFETGSLLASLETSKSVTEIYSPFKGTILKVNTLEDLPYSSKKSTLSLVHYINKDPENLGWILLLKPASILKPIPNEILNFKEYNKLCHSLIQ